MQAGKIVGADVLVNSKAQNPVQVVRDLTGGRLANRVIDASARPKRSRMAST